MAAPTVHNNMSQKRVWVLMRIQIRKWSVGLEQVGQKNISHYPMPWSVSKAWTGMRSVVSEDLLPTSSAPGLTLAQSTVNMGSQSPKLLVAFSPSSE